MAQLTELELKVVEVLESADHFEDMPTESLPNMVSELGIGANILRGVLSSLSKKGLVEIGEYPNGLTAFHYKG